MKIHYLPILIFWVGFGGKSWHQKVWVLKRLPTVWTFWVNLSLNNVFKIFRTIFKRIKGFLISNDKLLFPAGIPIAVVCTKVDAMSTLEKDLDYTDPHFDLIQWHLRKFCLKYGAALFYVNGKESANADYLYKYVLCICGYLLHLN